MTIDGIQMAKEEEWSEDLAKRIDEAFLKTRKMPFDELVRIYKEIERQMLAHLSGEEFLILETKRRVAEQILYRAAERCSLDVCRELLRDLLRLGFTDLRLKSTAYISHSMVCEEDGQMDEGIALLEALEQELSCLLENVPRMLESNRLSVRKRLARMRRFGGETQDEQAPQS